MIILAVISVGELLDKISILEIKLSKIFDSIKLKSIKKEYEALHKILKDSHIIEYEEFLKSLKNINLELWEVEDMLRLKERHKKFGKEFVELARKVYILNDRRFKVKEKVNYFYGSEIKEEKSYYTYEDS
tara:strand:+ start:4432 stop:4821 length:390 start_codon:yes stop_codon:yes gene_type:complete